MPFDVIGFYESSAQTFAANVTPAADSQYSIVGTDYYLVQNYAPWLAGVFHCAVSTPGRCRVFQPQLTPPYDFIKSVVYTTTDPYSGFTDMLRRPLPLTAGEQLSFKAINASTEVTLGGLFLSSGKATQAQFDAVNPTHRLMGYSDTDAVAGAWTNLAVVWDEVLPEGRYAIVGMRAATYKSSGPGLALYRIILIDSAWRPGCLGSIQGGDRTLTTVNNDHSHNFADWPLMQGIDFDNVNPPQIIQVLSTVANTDHEFELSLQKIH